METTQNRTATSKSEYFEEPRQSKIIIRHTFGDQNLIELYADYVVEKIVEEMRQVKDTPVHPS